LELPYVALRRPEWDKFPGAYYSIALDIPVGEARTLQIGSIHHYRENFSKPYGIAFEAPDGSQKLVHQTTFGLSERLLGAVVAVHGDQKGVAFPSSIAPYQVVVVPIAPASAGDIPRTAAQALTERLKAAGLRVHLDASEDRPGAKYYRWESVGVPLRLEVGPREAKEGSATAVDRKGTKGVVGPEKIEEAVRERLAAFDRALGASAQAAFKEAFSTAKDLGELAGSTKARVLGWCGKEECGHEIEKAIDGSLLGTPQGATSVVPEGAPKCIACGAHENAVWAIAARPL
ncbi:MAG: His/Gly/Thr/Pro-type tRNA ligase C-terminal domain-containing protein, partial [Thermoplasmata archaeon]|nr:His/Gly/Thr/Pro-type tRNA ligase C-terminal domain-containing protein [Thermoplasmata archaeon]